ncbi:hypothetical protein [Streptosporangium sp. NPDC006930]|uniref:hypothetical protein n=1 Tax=Streptosporangium sp. NPDC006930 TaxID=3154783 RepID=UPI003440F0B3
MTAQVRSHSVASGNGQAVADRPSGVRGGDQLWAIHFVFGVNELGDMTAPPGWAPAPNGSLQAEILAMRIWRRNAGGAEPGNYVFGHAGEGIVHVIAVKDASTTISARITAMQGVDTVVPTPAVPPASPATVEIRAACVYTYPGTVTWQTPAGYTSRGQVQAADLFSSAAASRTVNSSSSGQQTFTLSPVDNRFGVGVSISIASAEVAPDPDPPPPYSPGVGDALYTYSFTRLLDRSYLGDLDLTGVSFEKRINRAGQINSGPFSGRIAITSPEVSNLVNLVVPRDPLDLTRGPGVICCDILRGGDPAGQYWIIGATVSKTRRGVPVLELRGLEIDAYWAFVELQEAIGELGGDREDIARELLYHLASQPHANLGLVLQAGSSGSAVNRTYTDEAQRTYAAHLAELTEGVDGFEHVVDIVAGPGGLERHWRHGAPLGDPDAKHSVVESPEGGDILDWKFEIAPLRNATRWRARGDAPSGDASTTAVPLVSTVHESTAHLNAGWPRIDRTVDRPGVLDVETLEDYAARWAATSSGAVRIWTITILAGEKSTITMNSMGDGIGVSMINEYFPQVGSGSGYEARQRMLGIKVIPVGRENGADEFELILAEPQVVE